jgi:hypothetical protein
LDIIFISCRAKMSRAHETKRRRLNVARVVGRSVARAGPIGPVGPVGRAAPSGVRSIGTSLYFYCQVCPATLLELQVALQRAADDLQEAWAAETSWDIGLWLYINAGGGSYVDGLAAYDIVRLCPVHVTTIVIGRAQGAAALMALGGMLRVMTSSSRIVPAAEARDAGDAGDTCTARDCTARDCTARDTRTAREVFTELDLVVSLFNARDNNATQIPAIIACARGVFALEAREIGLVDEVW